jgi:hypothetical protein
MGRDGWVVGLPIVPGNLCCMVDFWLGYTPASQNIFSSQQVKEKICQFIYVWGGLAVATTRTAHRNQTI